MAGTITGPDISDLIADGATVGLPANTKDRPRVDFSASAHEVFIEQHGVRVAWSKSASCPCAGDNDQTRQPGINCPLCNDQPGYIYFRPEDYVVDEERVGELDDVQKFLVNRASSPAVIIHGLIQGIGRSEATYDRLGQWVEGTISVSIRKDNRVGYYDRLTLLDQLVTYSEIILSGAADVPINLRFPGMRMEFVRTEAKVMERDTDYFLNNVGQLCFQAASQPPKGTKISVTYLHRPQFLVWEHLHAVRATKVNTKLGRKGKTPLGDPQLLPLQALAKLEFLIGRGS